MASKVSILCQKCREESSIEGKEIKNVAILTIAFQLVYTGFYALQNLHSSLHDEDNLGLVCLSVMYGTGIVSSVLSPTIIGMFGVKPVLVTAFAAHSIYTLANFYASFASMVPGAIFLGAFFGPAWTSQGVYVSACSYSYSKTSSSSPFSVLSKFNGFFFAMMASTQIVGNVITSMVIRDGIGNNSEVLTFKYCGPKDCPAFENATQIEDVDVLVIDIILFVFLALAICGLLLVFFALTPLPRSEWISEISPRQMTVGFVQLLFTSKMSLLVPFMIFTGMEHAFLMGSFTKSYISCPIGIHMVGFVMSAYGITTPVFFLIFSKLVRVTGRFVLLMTSSFLYLILLVFLLHWEPTEEDESIVFLVPVLWGVAESILQAQANALIALMFPIQKESAFANFHAWRSLGYCVTFLNVAYLCVSDKIIICIVFLVVGSGLYVYVEIKTKVKENDEMKSSPSNGSQDILIEEEGNSSVISKHVASDATFQSIQERLSFSHHELTDIIKDAESCWHRESNGSIVLKVDKVMSEDHLRGSKVTTHYHARPLSESLHSQHLLQQLQYTKSSPALLRSQSEINVVSSRRASTPNIYNYNNNNDTNNHSKKNNRKMLSDKSQRRFSSVSDMMYDRTNLPGRRVFSFHAGATTENNNKNNIKNNNNNTLYIDAYNNNKVHGNLNNGFIGDDGYSENSSDTNSNSTDKEHNGCDNNGFNHDEQSERIVCMQEDGKENIELKTTSNNIGSSSIKHSGKGKKNETQSKPISSENEKTTKASDKTKNSSPPPNSIIQRMNKQLTRKEKKMKKQRKSATNKTYDQEIIIKKNSENKITKKSSESQNVKNKNSHKNKTKTKTTSFSTKPSLAQRRRSSEGNNLSHLVIKENPNDLTNGEHVSFYLHSPGISPNSPQTPNDKKLSQYFDKRLSISSQVIVEEEIQGDFDVPSDADSDGFVDILEEDVAIDDDDDDVVSEYEMNRILSNRSPDTEDTISIY